jgi:hypothetical protein
MAETGGNYQSGAVLTGRRRAGDGQALALETVKSSLATT